MLSGLWNLENVMMMPNTLGLFEQLVPFNFTNFIKDTKKKRIISVWEEGIFAL